MLLAELSPIEEITELQVAPRAESINRFLDEGLNGRPIVLQTVSNVARGNGSSLRTDGSCTSRSGLAYGGGVRSTP